MRGTPGADAGPQPAAGTVELTTAQLEVLHAVGSADPDPAACSPGAVEAATHRRLDELIVDALTAPEAAVLPEVPELEVLAAVAARELYAVPGPDGPLLLRAQLTADGQLPPGMGRVLRALPLRVPPLVVDFVLTHPQVDLVLDGERVDPRQWLVAGQDPGVVVAIARGLLDVP